MDAEGLILQQLADLQKNFTAVIEATSATSQRMEDLYKELLGDGQPGRIQRIETAQLYVQMQLNKHQDYIQRRTGAWGVVGTVADYLMTVLVAAVTAFLTRAFRE